MPEYENVSKSSPEIQMPKKSLEISQDTVISTELVVILQWIIFGTLGQIIIVYGVAGNIINIICFVKQGFSDTVNVTFLGLAIADVGCLTTLIWTNIGITPAFYTLDLPFEPLQFQYLTSGIPHVMFTRISSWITALITMERCLCITMPLKVKDMVTLKRLCIIMICIFVLLMLSMSPIYFVYNLGNIYDPVRNKTLIGIVYVGDRETFDPPFYAVSFFTAICAFVVITVCTIILVMELKDKAKWRQNSTSNADNLTTSNIRVAKMVVMVSALYITCFTPFAIQFVAMASISEFSVGGKLENLLTVLCGVGSILESINSSSNFIIYYHMSSKFRKAFFRLFPKCFIRSSD